MENIEKGEGCYTEDNYWGPVEYRTPIC